MSFQKDKQRIVAALRAGRISHERRSYQYDKNLLASGQLSEEEAAALVEAVRGHQAELSVHHFDPAQGVWILKPVVAGQGWYLKVYLTGETVVFLSCHCAQGESP